MAKAFQANGDKTPTRNGAHLKITIQGVAAFVGISGGLLTSFVLVQPWTPLYLGYLKLPAIAGSVVVGGFFLVCWLERQGLIRTRSPWVEFLAPTPSGTIGLLGAACVLGGLVFWAWPPPTSQQIAQQILNDRGMFLRRLY